MEYIVPNTLYVVLHIIGIAVGAGAAFMSDVMYMRSVKNRVLSATELAFLKLSSAMVWVGVAILLVSGALLFSTNPEIYLSSSKFQLKMVVVAVIIINGSVVHFLHIPVFKKTSGTRLDLSKIFKKKSKLIYTSGAASIVSWLAAIVLGAMRSIPYTFPQGAGMYAGALIVAIIFSQAVRISFFRK